MTGHWSNDLLQSVIDDAKKQNKDIADAVDGLEDAPKKRVLQGVRDGRADIEEAALDEFSAWNQLLKQKADDISSAISVGVDMPLAFSAAYYFSATLVGLWWLAIVVAYPVYGVFIGDYKTPWTAVLNTGGWPLLIGIVAASGTLFFIRHRIVSHYNALEKQAQEQMRITLDIDGTQARIDAIRLKLLERGVDAAAQVWRKVINERLRPNYRTAHDFAAQPALEASVQRSQMVRTPAYSNLIFMLENLRGSSIGIAGPRGAGKSTLLQWVCDDKQTTLGKRDVLTVLTAAPVDYQARDFLLHLFASLCHRTIERLAPGYERTNWKRHVAPEVASGADVWRATLTGALAAFVLGAMLWISSVTWAVNLALMPVPEPAKATVATPAVAAPPQRASAARELGLTPAKLFSASLVLLCGGGIALVAVQIRARRSMPATSPRPNPPSADDLPGMARQPWFPLMRWYASTRAALTPQADALPPSEIVQEALAWLQEIKFQQSYTLGWTGALKMPLGVEGSLTQARSMAQHQLTLPELVDAYKRFLDKIAARYTVLIGIDELDKIESDEKAQRFLNDIKIVFGVYNVFFLVSVSENAMSQFERRGLPFRDAFDTAFDDVIIVDHLRFKQSRRLLDERILALPVQFQALCHVMSAGLARELVRTLRDLVRAAKDADGNGPHPLEELVKQLIEGEVSAKVAAFRALAERLPPSSHREALLLQTHHIGGAPATAKALYDSHLALLPPVATPRWWGRPAAVAQPEQHATVLGLKEELATYLQFLAAVMLIFTADLNEAATQQAEARGTFDDLATARRAQSVNQSLARSLVDKVLTDMRVNASWRTGA